MPLFFARDGMTRLPRGWIRRMKSAIAKLVPRYNTARMVREYTRRFYVPAIKLTHKLTDGDLAAAKALTAWKEHVRDAWHDVAVARDRPRVAATRSPWASRVTCRRSCSSAALTPEDVAVELYHGPTAGGHEIARGQHRAHAAGRAGRPTARGSSAGEIPTSESGAHAFAARVVPYNEAMSHPYETSLIRWA